MAYEKNDWLHHQIWPVVAYELSICLVIFASQVSDSLALIYPLADLVGFSKPSQ